MTNIFFAGILMLLFVLSAQADECKKVIISSDSEYPPISWRDPEDPDNIIGTVIELAEMVFNDLGVSVETPYVGPWKRTLRYSELGRVDMIAGVYMNEERKSYLDYVLPTLMVDQTVVFTLKGQAFKFEQWDDLKGLQGGRRLGDSFGDSFDQFEQEHLKLDRVEKSEQLLNMLQRGRNQYFIYGLYPGLAYAEKMGIRNELEYLPKPLTEENIYLAFSKKSPCKKHSHIFSHKMKILIQNKVPELLVEKYLEVWKRQAESTGNSIKAYF